MSEYPASPSSNSRKHEFLKDLEELRWILRRGWKAIVLSVLVCQTMAVLYLARAERQFQATTRLLVIQQGGQPLNVTKNDANRLNEMNEDYLPTHVAIIRSPSVVGRAIEAVGLDSLPSLQKSDEPVEGAIERLSVTRPDRQAKVLCADYRAGSREEATRMLTAITASYRGFLESKFQKNSSEVIRLIVKARDELNKELTGLEEQYRAFHAKSSSLILDEAGHPFMVSRLAQWNRAANEAMLKAVRLRSQLEIGRTLANEGAEFWAVVHAINQLGGESNPLTTALATSSSLDASADYIRQLKHAQQQLLDLYGPRYAKVQELQERISRLQGQSHELRRTLDDDATSNLLASIDRSLKGVEAMREEVLKRLDRDQEAAKQVEADLLTEANLRGALERQRSLFNTVVDQLKQAQFVSAYSTISAESIEPPHALRRRVSPRVSQSIVLGVLAGVTIGVGVAFLIDRLDPRIRSIEELRAALGSPVLVQLPRLSPERSRTMGELGLASHARPRSPWAEAFKALRTNLDCLRRDRPVQVILISSPQPGDGKSIASSNLAISLAHAGRKVLLVDGDLRKPSQHVIHGVSREQGLVQVLMNVLSIRQVTRRTTIENLDLITTGPEVHNPAELLTSPRFAELLGEVRPLYDVIIIDSSPLLAVTDPAIIGAMVDGIVLLVRASKLRHLDAERTKELLRRLGTPVLGTVINWIGREHGESGDGYGYCYGYGADGDSAPTAVVEPTVAVVSAGPVPAWPRHSANGQEDDHGHHG